MGLIEGPFTQVSFCGGSVTSFSSNIGWNEQSSTVTVNLVEDPDLGQTFTRPIVGTPIKFEYQGFVFEGLIQRWLEKNALDGKPTFEVTLTDPREILAGTQVILSSFRGEVNNFANLLNAFGYWESILGFGGSMVNESGMVWCAPFEILGLDPTESGGQITITPSGTVGIMPALHNMTQAATTFGGPLQFRGYSYVVDLSSLPVPPAYYRMGGVAASILDMVSEICQDGGHDYICTLTDNVIGFKTVSRVTQPDPGQIANFVNSRTDVVSKSLGIELRNDVTNAIVLGGDYTQLIQENNSLGDDTIWPYWGKDFSGNVIVGTGRPEETHLFDLNATKIGDIMGSLTYPCDIPELRCALMDFDSWAYYVLKYYPEKAEVINLTGAIDYTSVLRELFPGKLFTRDLMNDTSHAVRLFGEVNETEYWTKRAQNVYDFVKQVADEYFGRKFLVKIPFLIYYKQEPETTHIIKSDEPTDAAYVSEGSSPLGLNFVNEDMFLTGDGRFQCFVKFANVINADLQKLSNESCLVQGTDIYMKANIDSDIGVVYPGGSIFPYVVITVDSPVWEFAPCPLGDLEDVLALLDLPDIEVLKKYTAGLRFDSFPLKVHPGPYRPDSVAIPMKSNRDSYGPWFTSGGADGKVSFERDEGLVPWNYGGYSTLDLAAQAKLMNAATQQQYSETGNVEVAGTPDYSLGDELVSGGPQLTGIDVNIGTSGVTTAYRMQTFTPRFGQFTKDNADRLRRLGGTAMEMRRAVRTLFHKNQSNRQIVAATRMGFMRNASRGVQQQTPHQCMLAMMSHDETHKWRTMVASMTAPEVIANCRGDRADEWSETALMTMEGLLRPFATNKTRAWDDPKNAMPHYEAAKPTGLTFNQDKWDPFGTLHDVDYMAWGDEYPGHIHRKKADGGVVTNSRLIGLRGPLVVVGWGYSYTGKPMPNSDSTTAPPGGGQPTSKREDEWATTFLSEHRKHPEKWMAGPVGLHWDNWRKMWTIPTFLFGTLDEDYASGGTLMTIEFNGVSTTDKVKVHSWFGGDAELTEGTKICAAYYQQANIWRIIAAECAA